MSSTKRNTVFILFVLLVVILFTSCGGKNNSATVNGFKNLGTMTVGAEGANIEEQDLQVNIAPDTFLEDTLITINRNKDERPLGENQASEIYQITGITDDMTKPITIRLKPNMELKGETFITIGYYTYAKSLNSYIQDYIYLDTIESEDGYLEAQFLPHLTEKTAMAKVRDWFNKRVLSVVYANDQETEKPSYGPYNITVTTNKQTIISENKFELIADLDVRSEDLATCMTTLEDTYAYYEQIGFDMSKFKEWPIKVYIEEISTFGLFTKIPGFEAKISLNKNDLGNIDELKITAAHEFLHAVQYGYGFGNWLDEATATWSESRFPDKSGTIQNNFKSYGLANNYVLDGPMQPYITGTATITKQSIANYTGKALNFGASLLGTTQSLVSDKNIAYTEHGYAMTSIIQYLVDKHKVSVIPRLHQGISDGKTPMESINAIEDMNLWANDYYHKLISGKITNAKFTDFYSGVLTSDILDITIPDKEQLKKDQGSDIINKVCNISSTLEYPYSSKVFKFNFKLPATIEDVDFNYALKFENLNTTEYQHLFAVALHSSTETKVFDASNNTLTIPFKDLITDQTGKLRTYQMLVAVVNPSIAEQVITIEATIVKDTPPLSELVGVWSEGTFTFTEVVIDPEVERAAREEDEDFFEKFQNDEDLGCDAQILVAFKDMIGKQQAASFEIAAEDEVNGSFKFLNIFGQDQSNPTPIEFTYENGNLEGILSNDGITNTLKMSASYNDTKTKVLLKGTLLCEMPVTGMTTLGSFTAELDFSKDYVETLLIPTTTP